MKIDTAPNSNIPILLNRKVPTDEKLIANLSHEKKIFRTVDDYIEQLRELFAINHPEDTLLSSFEIKFQAYRESLEQKLPIHKQGMWAYFPWNGSLIHILEDSQFQKVRMARNRYLIDEAEQKKFYETTIGIAGLSVGFSTALAVTLEGGAKKIKLADHDHLALSNINRIPVGIHNLGLPKTIIAARRIYEINPYAEIEIFSDGITEDNVSRFTNDIDIALDEMDSFPEKFLLRREAKKHGIAVLSAIDNEEEGLLDIERYDVDRNLPYWNGRLGDVTYEKLMNLSKQEIGMHIARLVGEENTTPKMKHSLKEIGKSIVSWPQLGGTALLNGGVVAYAIRMILRGEKTPQRVIVSLDDAFIPDNNTERHIL